MKAVRLGVTRPLGEAGLRQAEQLAEAADAVVVFAGLTGEWDTESRDRQYIELVVLQTGGPVTMPWLDQVAAVLQAWYPGQECGNAIADVLFGDVNPSGKLPQTFPVQLEDHPAFINYPGENGRVKYGEGIFVGYQYYEKKKVTPLFPFGHGLSYTTFSYSNLRLSVPQLAPNEELTASLEVTIEFFIKNGTTWCPWLYETHWHSSAA